MNFNKPSKLLALSMISMLISGNLLASTAQAETLKKIAISKAGRVIAPVTNTLLSGKGAPKSTKGIDGDFYIDTNNMNIYGPKINGKWPAAVSLKGSPGTNGINGSTGATGAKGTSTTGNDGAPGVAGPSGAPGSTGATGPAGSGSPGATGPAGSNGSSGTNGTNGSPGTTGSIGATGPKGETGTAGSSEVSIFNLTGVGGGTNWGLSSATATETFSNPFGNLQPNTKYRFTIFISGTANRTGFATYSVGSNITATGAGTSLNFSTHYGIGLVSNPDFVGSYTFSFIHEGVVTTADSVSSLTVSVIDGTGWSAALNAYAFEIKGKAFVQVT